MDVKILQNKIGDRDVEIVRSLSCGKTAHAIGEEMSMNEDAVMMRIFRLRTKLKLKNTPELVAFFLRNKIIE